MALLLELFYVFFKIGLFTFGGGYAMIPLVQSEVVSRGWADLATVADFIAVAESTPGPFATNLATFVGISNAGIIGALVATLAVTLPSFIVIILVVKAYAAFSSNKVVAGALKGLRACAVGLIASSAVAVTGVALTLGKTGVDWRAAALIASCLAGQFLFPKVHPVVMLAASAVAGMIFFRG